jgi:hypothetical protein
MGGYQWLVHLGQTVPVAMLALAGLLSFSAALVLRVTRQLPVFLGAATACVAGLHLLNTLTFVLSSREVPFPLALLAAYLPTAIVTLGLSTPMTPLLLPAATLALSLGTIARYWRRRATPQDA